MADTPQKFDPPNRLSKKVSKTSGPTPEKAILRALNAAEDLIDSYQGWAVDDLAALWKAYEDLRTRARHSRHIAEDADPAIAAAGGGWDRVPDRSPAGAAQGGIWIDRVGTGALPGP